MIGELLALAGSLFVLLAAIGVVRFSDVFARMHALSKASTLGVLLLIAGAAVSLHDVNDITSVVLAMHSATSIDDSFMFGRARTL